MSDVARLRVTGPGIFSMSDLDYHADPAPEPSLSRSIAKVLTEASPAHAYAKHPRLGGAAPTGSASGDDDMDIGSAAHALFLEGADKVAVIPFDSYRSKESKEMRDDARREGRIPLKAKQYEAAINVVVALEEFRIKTGLFTAGKPEQTLVWNEGDHWARARIDWLPDDPAAPLLDLKTTSGLATGSNWGRQCFQFGADIQAAMYPRGCELMRGEPPDGMIFVVVETSPPYGIRVFQLDRVAVEVGEAKLKAARQIWAQCLKDGQWPGYSLEPEWIFPPPWVVTQWESFKTYA